MITIVDYGLGNVGSLRNMLKKIGKACALSADPEAVAGADRLILPGVGAFDAGVERLRNSGLDEAIRHAALVRRVPVLGICLGMQLLGSASEEGRLSGLALVEAECRRFVRDAAEADLPIPHMGWNAVRVMREHRLFAGLETANRFYFVHSYRVVCRDPSDVLGVTDYGGEFTSSFAHGNICAAQFHPEKSHRFGMKLLGNFAEM
ncbi:MAG: imidazole glycerol phosphate synthase subunit HisH [Burkholderiaceae bacterium]|nr:imidazole glycerol phosphate synthase subunit HisH [Burkholderiaceae bacterium]